MKVLHTSDWHVGRTIRGKSRTAEHEAVLGELVTIAARERVELVLVAGDQFDTAAPAPEAERIVYRALLDLAETGAEVVVVSGNHDNPARLDAVAPLLAHQRVHAGAVLRRPEEGGLHTLESASGEIAQIALLPFLSQRGIVRADELMALDADQHAGRYTARARAIIDILCGHFRPDTVNLVVSHLMVTGGLLGGGERQAHTIFDYCVAAQSFPATAHYVALGHLHRQQQIPAAAPVWYSGSPLALDFGEEADQKGALLIEASPGRPAEITPVPLTAGRRLRTLRGTLDELESMATTTGDDYLRVVVRGQARAGMVEAIHDWFPEAVDVLLDREQPDVTMAETPRRLGRSPHELFEEYLEQRSATDERVSALFGALLDEVTTAGHEAS